MTLNDVALLYAALGVSWGGLTTYRAVKEMITGKPEMDIPNGKAPEERKAMVDRLRDELGTVPPALGAFVIVLGLVTAFVVNAVTWPFGIARGFRKGGK